MKERGINKAKEVRDVGRKDKKFEIVKKNVFRSFLIVKRNSLGSS